jgi:hypothetical protein
VQTNSVFSGVASEIDAAVMFPELLIACHLIAENSTDVGLDRIVTL